MSAHRVFNIGMDVLSGAAIASALMQWLPPLAALGGVIWYAIQIYESKTVTRYIRLLRTKARLKRLSQRS